MKTHNLKCWPEYFRAVLNGEKTFELRFNDRDYRVGDVLVLEEYDNKEERNTGCTLTMKVTYILDAAPGLQPGWVAMAIKFY